MTRTQLRAQFAAADLAGGVLRRKTISGADITPFNRGTMEVTFGANDIVFVARILWASQ